GTTPNASPVRGQEQILTPRAMDFLAQLHHEFEPRRKELLALRETRRREIAGGQDPHFLEETRPIREDDSWTVAPIAPGLEDRRVEITGPPERKMAVNALNSGANVWLADLEDCTTPTWQNVINGQLTLRAALENDLDFTSEEGQEYTVTGRTLTELPTIMVRPRGWHLPERHLTIGGKSTSGALVDFGLYFFHNAQRLISGGRGPYFYLPKIENHLEARLWNDVFIRAQELLDIPRGTIRATVFIETITAAFELEEILYELREHSAGLNAGRWDYIFSVIKNFRTRGPRFVLPDRAMVTMTAPFMRSFTEQLVRACHRRGATAIGSMSAFIPNRRDEAANAVAFETVGVEKSREAADGFDGAWVAHPDLVPVVQRIFDREMGGKPNQIDRLREDVAVDDRALLDIAGTPGLITEGGVRMNVVIGLRYIESWLRGNGAVVLKNMMEDASTAEISRSQIWQWIHQGAVTDDGELITAEFVEEIVEEEYAKMERFEGDRFADAREIFDECALQDDYPAFLTVPSYTRFLCQSKARQMIDA
ncbi:MAG: malate synthase A, partial [Micrococcaceae bacterium]|nr:malate synthase A [Micrococcaceae bacterium]